MQESRGRSVSGWAQKTLWDVAVEFSRWRIRMQGCGMAGEGGRWWLSV